MITDIVEGPTYLEWGEDSYLYLNDYYIVRKKSVYDRPSSYGQETYNKVFRSYEEALKHLESGLDEKEWSEGHPLAEYYEEYEEDGRLYNSEHTLIG